MESYKDYLKEGDIYDIENFRVMDNDDDYKLAAHSFKLNFIPSTVFRELSVNIVLRGFHLIPIKSIIEETTTNVELIGDVSVSDIFLIHFITIHRIV